MDTKSKGLLSGMVAFALAVVIILSATFLGFAPVGSRGVLSVMLTDPASVPSGVTAVFVTYDNLQIHSAGSSPSAWVGLNSQGTIESLGLINQSEIISSVSIPSGTYDSLSLHVTACQVEFQGKNYSATIYNSSLQAAFTGSLTLNPSSHSTALVDMQPTILNLGSTSNPQFFVNTAAKVTQVPTGQVKLGTLAVGSRTSLASNGWFTDFLTNSADRLTISKASVASDSFLLDASNPSHGSEVVKMIIVTPIRGPVPATSTLPTASAITSPSLIDSAVFVVEGNGTLHLTHFIAPSVVSTVAEVQQLTASSGYEMLPSTSVSFTYNGTVTLTSGGSSSFGGNTLKTFYVITILGNQVLARIEVKGS